MTHHACLRLSTTGVLWAALVGCGPGPAALLDAVPILPGDECAEGGVRFDTGVDEDGDGVLSQGEISDSVVLCNGADGASGTDGSDGSDGGAGSDGSDGSDGSTVLLRSADLADGEEGCEHGGTRIEVGLDNGDGGETAGDGVLGDGEVDATEVICDGAPELPSDELDAPSGPVGTATIDASGGHATGGDAGGGGGVEVWGAGFRSNTKLFQTGAADASFTLPTVVPQLGAHPLIISSDTTIDKLWPRPTLTDGEPYISLNGQPWIWRADGNDVEVTGLHIQAGATLTLRSDFSGAATLLVDDDMVIDGTLTTINSAGANIGLHYLSHSTLLISASGLVFNPGNGTAGEGRSIVFEGTIDASGGAPGDEGGDVELQAPVALWATGQLLSRGADHPTGQAGSGGHVRLGNDDVGPTMTSAFIDVRGGDGDQGGDGGDITLDAYEGRLLNSGELLADGGSGQSDDGGSGGRIYVACEGCSTRSSGAMSASGGSSVDELGGDGGTITIRSESGDSSPGSIEVSGSLIARAGDGDHGGDGGAIEVLHDEVSEEFAPVALYGYASLSVDGGSSQSFDGGGGGGIELGRGATGLSADQGGVVNHVPLSASGGDGSGGEGGGGGEIDLYVSDAHTNDELFVYSRADMAVDSGDGGPSDNGDVQMSAPAWIDHEGDVSGLGGSSNDDEDAGDGAYVEPDARHVRWHGDLHLAGGVAGDDAEGGDGGGFWVQAETVDFAGAFDAPGGDAGLSNGAGGEGGYFWAQSMAGLSSAAFTSVDVSGGDGESVGDSGSIWLDGIDATP